MGVNPRQLSQESVGDYSRSFDTSSAQPGRIELTDYERGLLGRYRAKAKGRAVIKHLLNRTAHVLCEERTETDSQKVTTASASKNSRPSFATQESVTCSATTGRVGSVPPRGRH
ncbi:hypothetical protein [Nocardiopsis xinjiangensis]|uniref:hypothetical protein n=1 Tax=Nocardiopsis xinjiangensis TaxID=124285 RepID=UPI0004757E9E|nr:hypothetical protein [Nocardiopsis xinjiangensis]